MELSTLITHINPTKVCGKTDLCVTAIEIDSRKIEKDNLFVALRGTLSDGHQYVDVAIQKGATVIVCEQLPDATHEEITYLLVDNTAFSLGRIANIWYDFPSQKLQLVGVTGTNGKTTIATLLYELFRKFGHKVGLISTVCNYIDTEKKVATHTTPDALALNKLLSQMVAAGCEYAFMEVSSHAIEQQRIADVHFVGAVFTNITRDHIDYHRTFDNYLKTKKMFFDNLPKTAFALTNIDDKNGMVMLQNTKANRYRYSIRSISDFRAIAISENMDGMMLEIDGKEFYTPFVGKFNVSNLTAVYAVARLLGQESLETLRQMSLLRPVAGRFETLKSSSGYTAIVDYAHTPDALQNVISTIIEILERGKKLITVVGCGGNRDKGKRPLMAREAVRGSWKTVLTSDNPRDEDPMGIIQDMLAGLDTLERKDTLVILDRREAIKTACLLAQEGDVVLIAGKGHEDYQIIKGVKYHFDDKEEVKKYL